MSAVAVVQLGSRLLHDTVLDPETRRPLIRCSRRPAAVVWLSADAVPGLRLRCTDCLDLPATGGPVRRRSWWIPEDPQVAS